MSYVKINYEIAQEVRRLVGLGVSLRRTAEKLNIPSHTVADVIYKNTFSKPLSEWKRRTPGPIEPRFWAKVDICKHGKDCLECCWAWQAGRNKNGYGNFRIPGQTKNTGNAHRYALTLKLGREIKDGMLACHTCHNPSCVNPAHLYEGTWQTNMDDKMKAGRCNPAKGPRPHTRGPRIHTRGPRPYLRKYTNKQRQEAKDMRNSGIKRIDIAAHFGITIKAVDNILYKLVP